MRWRPVVRWTLRVRLTAAFLVVVVVAVLVVGLQVLPALESSLAQQRMRVLVSETSRAADTPAQDAAAGRSANARREAAREVLDSASARTGGRASVLAFDAGPASPPTVLGATVRMRMPSDQSLGLARDAARARASAYATTEEGDRRVARAAVLLRAGTTGRPIVLVVARDLEDVHEAVDLIRRRLFLGGGIALLFAVVVGGIVAAGVSARVLRLERGSREVAAGRFTTRFDTRARDELGSLARSLDTMQNQLAELDRSRRRFIATASHELRTPLSSLSGFVELLRDEEMDEATRQEFLDQLARQIERLGLLSGELLDLSKLESGGVELRADPVDLHGLAQDVAREFQPELERRDGALRVRLVGGRIQQRCDAARVQQVLRILVDNALKHSGPGAAVEIRVARVEGRSRIAVSDHGPGVDPADLPHLFEPFYGTGDGSGAGLGLAIARELAHRMRGRLEVEAEPGSTTFTLELPA